MTFSNTKINKQLVLNVFRDGGKVIKGFFAILWYGISKDNTNLSLSYFYTTSQVVKPGDNCTYEIVICNISKQSVWVKLRLDIYSKNNSVHPEGHYSYFEKAIFVGAHKRQPVHIIYDWKNRAVMDIDDVSFEPDVFWSGDCDVTGKYAVKAFLIDEKGKVFDELTLVQKLSE